MRYGILARTYNSTSNWQDIMPDKVVKSGTGTVNIENGILKCKSNALGEAAYAYLPFVMSPGAMCEVQFLARRESGTSDLAKAGGVAFNNYTEPQTSVGGNLQDVNKIVSSEWQLYQYAIAGSPDKPYYALFLGAYTNSIGEFWFKDLKINWYGSGNDIIKFAKIYKDNGVFKVDQKPNGINSRGVIKVQTFADYFRVHYTNNEYWQAPVVMAQVYWSQLGWTAHVGATYRGYCDIKIANASGQIVNTSTIPDTFGLSVAILG